MTTHEKIMKSTNEKNYTLYVWKFYLYNDIKNELAHNYRDFDHIPENAS